MACELLLELSNVLHAKDYATKTIRNYVQEMRLVFGYYNDLDPRDITQKDLINYINFIKTTHGVGCEKCRMVVASCGFFYKNVLRSDIVFTSEPP